MDDVVQRLEIVEAALTELQGTRATGRTDSAVTELDPQTSGTGTQTKPVAPYSPDIRNKGPSNSRHTWSSASAS